MGKTYKQNISELASMETFPAQTFIGDNNCPASVCNFILALSLVHNDLNDLDFAMDLLNSQTPGSKKARTPEWGKHIGLSLHIVRSIVSAVHELLVVISKHPATLTETMFMRVYRALSKNDRARWDELVAIAKGAVVNRAAINHYLMMARNKVGSHYDLKKIGQGYRAKFEQRATEVPLVSRGISRNTTRFYFADAAAEEVMFMEGDDKMIEGVLLGQDPIHGDINQALYHIITKFIQLRGGAYRQYRDDPANVPLTPAERRRQ